MHTVATTDQLILLAALQLQAEIGDNKQENLETNKGHIIEHISTYLAAQLTSSGHLKPLVDGILRVWSEFNGLTKMQAETAYIKFAKASPLYGCQAFSAHCRRKSAQGAGTKTLGAQDASLHRIQGHFRRWYR